MIVDLLGETGGVALGNSVVGNAFGLFIARGGVATQNSASSSQDACGIFADAETGVGLNVSYNNVGPELVGGTVIGCNSMDGVKTCP